MHIHLSHKSCYENQHRQVIKKIIFNWLYIYTPGTQNENKSGNEKKIHSSQGWW